MAERCVYGFYEVTDWQYGPSAVVISSSITIQGQGTLFTKGQEVASLRYFYVTLGEVFLSQIFLLPDPLSTNGKYYISGRADALTNVAVDDQMVLLAGGNVIFEFAFANEQGEIMP